MSKFVLFIALILGISGIIVCVRLPPVKAVDIIWKEGHITADETWFYIPNTIYRVIGDVYVDPGVKLTIEPNVTIQFADGFSLIVDGSLNATGTGSESIVFTSSRTSPSAGAWNTVMFRGNSGEEFLLKHVRLMYAANGVTVEGTTSARIETSEVFNCSTGLRLRGQSNVFIEHNKLMHNGVGVASEASFSGNIEAMNNTIVELSLIHI